MATHRSHAASALVAVVFAVFVALGCSGSDPVQPSASTPDGATDETSEPDTTSVESAATVAPSATSIPARTLVDDDLAEVVDLSTGEQTQDAQGNLVAIYGFVEWPDPFDALSDQAQTAFPFLGDVEELADPNTELVALDVGMCAAGIGATGFGTAEFFLHESRADVLSTDPVLNRGVLARHPVIQPGFDFPKSAECARGWLPVLWSGTEAPSTARYVLTSRTSADAEITRHVYQWDLEPSVIDADSNVDAGADGALFGVGQTVTFNQGILADTTVVVDGWAELIGGATALESTRKVAVSLTHCPASQRQPDFGLSVDGWNLVAPDGDSTLIESQGCFSGWLDFTVPFGAVPTGFFASDGVDPTVGYAEWSLENAALAAPE